MLKKVFSHTAIYGLAPQVPKLAYFFALPFITRNLTDVDFGISGIMTAYTTAISVFANLGLSLVLLNSFYRSPMQYKWGWRQIYGFLTLWNLVYSVILGILLYVIIPSEAIEHRWTILLLNIGPLIFFGQTTVIGTMLYRVEQKPLQIGARTAISGLLNVFLTILFVNYYRLGYMGLFWATFFAGMLTNVSYWYPLNIKYKIKPIFNFKWRYIRQSLKVTIPTIPHYYSSYLLSNSDKMVMDLLNLRTNDIGRYNFANTIGNLFQAIANAAGLAVGPLMNEMYKNREDLKARNLIFVLQIVFFCGTFCVSIWLKEGFNLFIHNDVLRETYPLAILIIMGYNYRPMYFGANNKLFYLEKTQVLWKVTFIAGVGNVLLNIVLIPIFGYKVGAITTYLSFLYMGYSGFFMAVNKEISRVNFFPVYWLASTIILTICAYYLVEAGLAVKAIVTVFACLGGTIALLFVTRQESRGNSLVTELPYEN